MTRAKALSLVATLLGLLGLADALYLTWLKWSHEVMGFADSSVCRALSKSGCQIALESRMGTVGPVSVSIIAAACYVVVVVLARISAYRAGFAVPALRLVSAGAVLWSLVLGITSLVARQFCPYCVALYVINLALLGVAWSLPTDVAGVGPTVRAVFGARRSLAWSVAGFLAATAGGHALYQWRATVAIGALADQDEKRLAEALALGRFAPPLTDAASVGPEDARFTIVEYLDFQCPHCRRLRESLSEVRRQRPTEIRIVTRHEPLSSECNPMMPATGHDRACAAAVAAECARRQGRFEEYADQLFTHQDALGETELIDYAREVGLDLAALETCRGSDDAKAAIRRDALQGIAVAALGTPTWYVNGMRLQGGAPVVSVHRMLRGVEALLERGVPEAPAMARQRAMLARPRVPSGAAGRAITSRLDAVDRPLPEVVAYVDPATAAGRRIIGWVAMMGELPSLRVGIRTMAPTCAADATTPACQVAASLACAVVEGVLSDVRPRLPAEGEGDDPAALAQRLSSEVPRVGACVSAGRGAALLAEDRAAAAAAGVTRSPMVVLAGYTLDAPETLDELQMHLAAALLAHGKPAGQ